MFGDGLTRLSNVPLKIGKAKARPIYPAEVGRNMSEILRVLEGFKISDEHDVAMPANWPNNELIKDRVIVPPPPISKLLRNGTNSTNAFIGSSAIKRYD